jgi:hypothetical protein
VTVKKLNCVKKLVASAFSVREYELDDVANNATVAIVHNLTRAMVRWLVSQYFTISKPPGTVDPIST